MQGGDVTKRYIVAEGPDGLRKVLDDFLETKLKDPEFGREPKYILYQLGSQKSLIKVDMTEDPIQFFYFDLLGRPATQIVKDTLADFLWEKGGEKERFLLETATR